MKELTCRTYPWDRLWSQDYTVVLFDSQTHDGTAEEWFAASGHEWLGATRDYGQGWKTRWGGRIEKTGDGIRFRQHSEYLSYMLAPVNPFLEQL
jgi:hypothetical protein